jgi:hypothetical protein
MSMVRLWRSVLLAPVLAACWVAGDRPPTASPTGKVWTRLQTDQPQRLGALLAAERVDVTGSHRRLGFVDVLTTAPERDELISRFGDLVRGAQSLGLHAAYDLAAYQRPGQIAALLDTVQASHPDLAKKFDLTPDGLFEGQHIYAMKITAGVSSGVRKPTVLFTGQIHAREVMTSEVTTDIVDYLTRSYGYDVNVTRWLDQAEVWVVPVQNPDGAEYALTVDPSWRKNRDPGCAVDINRNFEWNWRKCTRYEQCTEEENDGRSASSEPETAALTALIAQVRPMLHLDYHSYGEYILWPTGCGPPEPDEEKLAARVALGLKAVLADDDGVLDSYSTGQFADELYRASGTIEDEAYGGHGALSFTVEINREFQPPYDPMRLVTVYRQRAGWQYLLEQAVSGPAVRGRVFDAQTGAPVVASWVVGHPFASGQRRLGTDASGRFGRPTLPDSDQQLAFFAAGYRVAGMTVHVGTGPVDLEVPLVPGENHPPIAVVAPGPTVNEGQDGALDGSASTDPDPGAVLFYSWSQTSGPPIRLSDGRSARPTFVAPAVDETATASLELVVSDGLLFSAPAATTLTLRHVATDEVTLASQDTPLPLWTGEAPTVALSTIHLARNQRVLRASVHLEASPSVNGLYLSVTSPAMTPTVLRQADEPTSVSDFELSEVPGELSGGPWVLSAAGFSAGDRLDLWTLKLELVRAPSCELASDCHLANAATQVCLDHLCGISHCEGAWFDCDALPYDGCEADTAGVANCGGCGKVCAFANAEAICQSSSCVMGACHPGWGDCNQSPVDGCETSVTSDDRCGACDTACAPAATGCAVTQCVGDRCLPTFADCDGDAQNGCETDLSTSVQSCGACGHACGAPHAVSACRERRCVVVGCEAGWGDCNLDPADGCEADLDHDPRNCGECQSSCYRHDICRDGMCADSPCDRDGDGYLSLACGGDDCNDTDPTIHPGAPEPCDGKDHDCNGIADDGCPSKTGCGTTGASGGPVVMGVLLLGLGRKRRAIKEG